MIIILKNILQGRESLGIVHPVTGTSRLINSTGLRAGPVKINKMDLGAQIERKNKQANGPALPFDPLNYVIKKTFLCRQSCLRKSLVIRW